MWVKLKFISADEKTIVLPPALAMRLETSARLTFGGRTADVSVLYYPKLSHDEEPSFESPAKILLSKDLKSRLLIPDTQIYRVKIRGNTLSLGPVIGLLMGVHNHDYSPQHMQKYSDRFGVYKDVGGLICAFSSNSVVWGENKVYGLYLNNETGNWEYGDFPMPSVIYRRDFHQSEAAISRLKTATHGRLFNSYRFSKLELFDIIRQNGELALKLPVTEKAESFEQLKAFTDRHGKVILKPNNLSRGRGICILEAKDGDYIVSDYRGENSVDTILRGERELLDFYVENPGLHNDYLIQKHISLAKIDGSAFDIRVVMQKEPKGAWGLGGIECRVANPKSLITNISRGGYALELDKALLYAFGDESAVLPLSNEIYEYCRDICTHLDGISEHFAEFGLDIGLDVDRKIWLIEANVFPSFKGFRKMDYGTYLKIRYAPLLYALSLTEFADDAEE